MALLTCTHIYYNADFTWQEIKCFMKSTPVQTLQLPLPTVCDLKGFLFFL